MIIPRLLTIFTDQFYFSMFHFKVPFIWWKLVPGERVLRLPDLPGVNHFSYISVRRLTRMAFHGSNNFYPPAGRDSVKARQRKHARACLYVLYATGARFWDGDWRNEGDQLLNDVRCEIFVYNLHKTQRTKFCWLFTGFSLPCMFSFIKAS